MNFFQTVDPADSTANTGALVGVGLDYQTPDRDGDAQHEAEDARTTAAVSFVVSSLMHTSSYLAREEKLGAWRSALAAQASARAQALIVSDSLGEGTGTTSMLARWQALLQTALRYRSGVTGGAAFPFIPGKYQTGSITDAPVVVEGAVIASSSNGMNGRCAVLQDATSKLTYTFVGTSCSLLYFKGSVTGHVRIVLDDNAPVVIDTNSLTNTPAATAASWDSGALDEGTHVVVVTRDVLSPATKSPYVHGLLTANGDEVTGIRVVDGSRHGISSATLVGGAMTNLTACMAKAGTFALIVIFVGTNDYGASTPPATYKTNLDTQIAAYRAAGFAGSFVLVNAHKGGGRDEELWAAYGRQLALIEAGDANISYFDLRLRVPDAPLVITDPASLGLYADTLHYSDAGHRRVAQILADYLCLRAQG